MNRTAVALVVFSIVFLLVFGLAFLRSGRMRGAPGESPETSRARRKANRLTLTLLVVTVIGSWVGAAVIYSKGIDLSHLTIEMILASISLSIWAAMSIFLTLKLRQFSKKLELAGGDDAGLVRDIKKMKTMRFSFMFWFGLMVVTSVLSLINNLTSSAR